MSNLDTTANVSWPQRLAAIIGPKSEHFFASTTTSPSSFWKQTHRTAESAAVRGLCNVYQEGPPHNCVVFVVLQGIIQAQVFDTTSF